VQLPDGSTSRRHLRNDLLERRDRSRGRHFRNPFFPEPLTPIAVGAKFMHPHLFRETSSGNPAMIDLHYWTTPNGHKLTIFLEETGLKYKIFPVNIGKGEQFKPEFLAVAPNNRIPAIVDHEPKGGGRPLSIFESGAILLYLAEKTGKFLPTD